MGSSASSDKKGKKVQDRGCDCERLFDAEMYGHKKHRFIPKSSLYSRVFVSSFFANALS